MTSRLTRFLKPALAAASLLALAGGTAAVLQSSEKMLRLSFDRALAPLANAAGAVAEVKAPIAPIAGSEDFWLTAMRQDAAVPVSKGISLGDRITLRLNGEDRHYRITSVSEFTPGQTEIGARTSNVRLVLVTATDTSDATARPIRFVMEIEGTPVALIANRPPARTL